LPHDLEGDLEEQLAHLLHAAATGAEQAGALLVYLMADRDADERADGAPSETDDSADRFAEPLHRRAAQDVIGVTRAAPPTVAETRREGSLFLFSEREPT
jgi:hypothetical protein